MSSYFENSTVRLYVLYVLNMDAFMSIRYCLLFRFINSSFMHYLKYKNLNLNNWLITWLLIFDHFENLHVWKIYNDNVIQL